MYYNEKILFPTGGRSNFRIPTMIVTDNGTVLAFCNDRKDTNRDEAKEVTLSLSAKRPGKDFGEIVDIDATPGWSCGIGNAVYDPATGKSIIFTYRSPLTPNEFAEYTEEEKAERARQLKEAEERLKAEGKRSGEVRLVSTDNGESWYEEDMSTTAADQLHEDGKIYPVHGSTHGSAHGIVLRHGEHKGRLICPARTGIGHYKSLDEIIHHTYNCAIYSDDHGETWDTSKCVQIGTGEGTLIENADGSLTYNSRAYFNDGKRYLATSTDGGETWGNFRTDDFLIEQKGGGCNASFIRVELDELEDKSKLPEGAKDVTLFCNPRSEIRDDLMICVSFDSGEKWEIVKPIFMGHTGYSSLCFNPYDQRFYLLYEFGEKQHYDGGLKIAEFDLEWLLTK